MNVAIVHYHLNRGGVTQVIANHLRALATTRGPTTPERIAVLYGGRREGWPEELPTELDELDVSLHEVTGLDYDTGLGDDAGLGDDDLAKKDNSRANPTDLADALVDVLERIGFSPAETIIHAHNHALGKNVSMPGAVAELARRGYRLLLQIHDFAEDFRPENYRRLAAALAGDGSAESLSSLYPQAKQIHYATLNQRDDRMLGRAGVAHTHRHLLPNPVADFGELPPRRAARDKLAALFGVATDRRFILYPVRCIRRKNIGEALLWSALAARDATVGFTLAPINPREQPSYLRWQRLAAELDLPCVFETGAPGGLRFEENIAAAELLLTTSVAEGFGMVFVEAWLAGRPLVGRDLPEITDDFVAAGVRFDSLRPRISVPLDWVGEDHFVETFQAAYLDALDAYGCSIPTSKDLGWQIELLASGGEVDFALLGSRLQQEVITIVHGDARRADELIELNRWIKTALLPSDPDLVDVVARNAKSVRASYSLEVSAKRLCNLYQTVAASGVESRVKPLPAGTAILETFLQPARLHPIRLDT